MAGLAGKTAVITGSTSGIGEAIARRFAAEGARVVVSGRRTERGEAVVAAIRAAGGEALFQAADLRRPDDCSGLIHRAVAAYGGLDILVNNAGIFPRRPFLETTPDFWDEVFAVNLRAPFLCAQAAVPPMRERGGGCILNIGSGNAFLTGERLIAYGVSKAALYNLTMNLARCLAPDHIRVNWLTVGWVLTEQEFQVQEEQEGRSREDMLAAAARLPMGEYTQVEDVAAGCVFLASDEAARITGTDLNVTAGLRVRV